MVRYLAFAWTPEDIAQEVEVRKLLANVRALDHWREALSSRCLVVYFLSDERAKSLVHQFPDRTGVVFGTLFRGCSPEPSGDTRYAPVQQLSSAEAELIANSGGASLVGNFWGDYVAFWQRDFNESCCAVRGPFASLPLLKTKHRGITIYFSYFPDSLELRALDFTVDWEFIRRTLTKLPLDGRTALSEVMEVSPGDRDEIRRGNSSQATLWSALDIARQPAVDSLDAAIAQIRDLTQTCIDSWTSRTGQMMLRLSGGLDSSIVLSCVRKMHAAERVICINRYSDAHEEDEREYARSVANMFACELIELQRRAAFSLQDAFKARLSERPQHYLGQLGLAREEMSIARERQVDVLLSGSWGDQLFYADSYELTAADYVHNHGIDAGLLRVCLSAARVTRQSVWSILRTAAMQALRPIVWDPLPTTPQYSGLLKEDLLASMRRTTKGHPSWYRADRYVPPGKQFHVFSVQTIDHCFGPFYRADDPVVIAPLLSQPLVELCLRIPSYLHTTNGWDRELERRAFSRDLPPEIARRRSKGGQATHTMEAVKNNRQLVRELLLEGALVREGLLDRAKVEDALADRPTKEVVGAARLSRCINIEIWMRLFSSRNAMAPPVAQQA